MSLSFTEWPLTVPVLVCAGAPSSRRVRPTGAASLVCRERWRVRSTAAAELAAAAARAVGWRGRDRHLTDSTP